MEWDLSIQQILPYIDGHNYVKKIAELAKQDKEVVLTGIRHLVYYNCVYMSDIFQYTNMYRVVEGVNS